MWDSATWRLGSLMLLMISGGLADFRLSSNGAIGMTQLSAPCVFHTPAEQIGTFSSCNTDTSKQVEIIGTGGFTGCRTRGGWGASCFLKLLKTLSLAERK